MKITNSKNVVVADCIWQVAEPSGAPWIMSSHGAITTRVFYSRPALNKKEPDSTIYDSTFHAQKGEIYDIEIDISYIPADLKDCKVFLKIEGLPPKYEIAF